MVSGAAAAVAAAAAAAASGKRRSNGAMEQAAAAADMPECCRDRERRRMALQAERDNLRGALHATTQVLAHKLYFPNNTEFQTVTFFPAGAVPEGGRDEH